MDGRLGLMVHPRPALVANTFQRRAFACPPPLPVCRWLSVVVGFHRGSRDPGRAWRAAVETGRTVLRLPT
jgi:hypothetical protein